MCLLSCEWLVVVLLFDYVFVGIFIVDVYDFVDVVFVDFFVGMFGCV